MSKKQLWLHYFGLITSFLCLIHCLITPVLIVVFPLMFNQLFSANTHDMRYELFFILLLALASLTFWQGYQIHKSKRSLITAAIGFTLLTGSLLIHHQSISIALSTLGGVCMLAAHYWNYKLCRCHGHHH